jgi:hypothetical protein
MGFDFWGDDDEDDLTEDETCEDPTSSSTSPTNDT